MRYLSAFLILLLASCGLLAQEEKSFKFTAKITSVRVGFRSINPNEEGGQFKLGLGTPVYIDVQAGHKGIKKKKGVAEPTIEIEAADNEGVATVFRIPVDDMEGEQVRADGKKVPPEARTFVGYTKPGAS